MLEKITRISLASQGSGTSEGQRPCAHMGERAALYTCPADGQIFVKGTGNPTLLFFDTVLNLRPAATCPKPAFPGWPRARRQAGKDGPCGPSPATGARVTSGESAKRSRPEEVCLPGSQDPLRTCPQRLQ